MCVCLPQVCCCKFTKSAGSAVRLFCSSCSALIHTHQSETCEINPPGGLTSASYANSPLKWLGRITVMNDDKADEKMIVWMRVVVWYPPVSPISWIWFMRSSGKDSWGLETSCVTNIWRFWDALSTESLFCPQKNYFVYFFFFIWLVVCMSADYIPQ